MRREVMILSLGCHSQVLLGHSTCSLRAMDNLPQNGDGGEPFAQNVVEIGMEYLLPWIRTNK